MKHQFAISAEEILTAADAQDMIDVVHEIFGTLYEDGYNDIWQLTETSLKWGKYPSDNTIVIKTDDDNIAKALRESFEEEDWTWTDETGKLRQTA